MADATEAQIGQYVDLSYGSAASPPVWTPLGAVRNISGVGLTLAEVDTTTLDSAAKERIFGMKDGNQITVVFTTRSLIMDLVDAWIAARAAIAMRLRIPAPANEDRFFYFIPLSYDHGTIQAENLMEYTLTGRITGDISATWVPA